jgi:hypothetical protein
MNWIDSFIIIKLCGSTQGDRFIIRFIGNVGTSEVSFQKSRSLDAIFRRHSENGYLFSPSLRKTFT